MSEYNMQTEKKAALTIVGINLFLVLTKIIFNQKIAITTYADNCFMIALFFLMIGALFSILGSGFFDFFQKNMKRQLFHKKNMKKANFIPLSQVAPRRPTYWFEVASFFLLISLLSLLFT